MKTVIENKENWKNNTSPLESVECINPPHLEHLDFNPNYYCPNDNDLKVGDEIVIGTYASDKNGNPTIKWIETTIIGLPLNSFYHPYVTCRKLIKK